MPEYSCVYWISFITCLLTSFVFIHLSPNHLIFSLVFSGASYIVVYTFLHMLQNWLYRLSTYIRISHFLAQVYSAKKKKSNILFWSSVPLQCFLPSLQSQVIVNCNSNIIYCMVTFPRDTESCNLCVWFPFPFLRSTSIDGWSLPRSLVFSITHWHRKFHL